ADVDAGAAGRGAELVDDELADARQRVLAVAGEELRQLRIRGHPADEVVGGRGERVVATEALVEARLHLGVRVGERGQRAEGEESGEGEAGESAHGSSSRRFVRRTWARLVQSTELAASRISGSTTIAAWRRARCPRPLVAHRAAAATSPARRRPRRPRPPPPPGWRRR